MPIRLPLNYAHSLKHTGLLQPELNLSALWGGLVPADEAATYADGLLLRFGNAARKDDNGQDEKELVHD